MRARDSVSSRSIAALLLGLLVLASSPLEPEAEAQSVVRKRSTAVRVQSGTVRLAPTALPETGANAPAPPPFQTMRTVEPDGTIVIAYPDGRRRYLLPNGGTRLLAATGKPIQEWGVKINVQALDPPPPAGEKASRWFTRHSEELLDALMSVVTGDRDATRARYLKRESPTLTVYQKIDGRTKDLARLVAP
jgi:hypothetical protein